MLCFTSFAVIMSLGGGPKATTIELAIYQALRYDFDLAAGALLALWQMLLCCSLVLASQRFAKPLATLSGTVNQDPHNYQDTWHSKLWDGLWIGGGILLVVPPLLSVIISGINQQLISQLSSPALWQAISQSLQIATMSCFIAVISGIAILLTSRQWRLQRKKWAADGIELIGAIILVTPA